MRVTRLCALTVSLLLALSVHAQTPSTSRRAEVDAFALRLPVPFALSVATATQSKGNATGSGHALRLAQGERTRALEASGQSFTAKSVRIVVPFPAGGGLDFTTRIIARKLSDAWGQTVVVDNRPGASVMIGAESVVRAPKDGYTLLSCSPAEVALNVALYPKMSYDPMRELAPISLTATYANVIAVHASVPTRNWKELVAVSKRTPGGLGF